MIFQDLHSRSIDEKQYKPIRELYWKHSNILSVFSRFLAVKHFNLCQFSKDYELYRVALSLNMAWMSVEKNM